MVGQCHAPGTARSARATGDDRDVIVNTVLNAAVTLPAQPAPGAQPPPPSGIDLSGAAPTTGAPALTAAGAGLSVQPGGGDAKGPGGPEQSPVQQAPIQQTGGGGPLPADAMVASAAVQPELAPLLGSLVSVLGQLVASLSGGAAPVAGGGAVCDMPGHHPAQQAPGGPSEPAVPGAPPAAGAPPAGAQPAAPPATEAGGPVTGGGVTVDRRYITGTPTPGGLIEFLISNARTDAPGARTTDGTWTQIPDGSGATLQAHVHGKYAQSPHLLSQAVQRGEVAVHLHPDGLLHIHDIA
jgi:hypothetical protein